jgi:hypothetical protein
VTLTNDSYLLYLVWIPFIKIPTTNIRDTKFQIGILDFKTLVSTWILVTNSNLEPWGDELSCQRNVLCVNGQLLCTGRVNNTIGNVVNHAVHTPIVYPGATSSFSPNYFSHLLGRDYRASTPAALCYLFLLLLNWLILSKLLDESTAHKHSFSAVVC